MGILEGLLLLGFVVGLVAVLVYFARTRSRVMGYHDIPTPRINETPAAVTAAPPERRL